ncbi:MAG: acyl-CoA thioesterase [Solirubrobacteraceae bacterium]
MDPKPVAESQVLLAHWMGPIDANGSGNIHGGVIMRLVDEAAGLAALKHARQRVVTAGMDRVAFLVPIFVTELVTFKAMVNAAWRSSMEVGVRVETENPSTGTVRHSNTAYLTFVAIDEQGLPAAVPPAVATTAIERRRMSEADLRRTNRLAERQQIIARRAEEKLPTGSPGGEP